MKQQPQHNNPAADIVFTPPVLALDIINYFVAPNQNLNILDPCKGNGSFYNQFPVGNLHDWCELSEGRDFLDPTSFAPAYSQWIITNPPWSKIREFIKRGLEVSDNVVYLITINHLMTKARLRIIEESGAGIKELLLVDTPHAKTPWPANGFQLAACHIQKGWSGPVTISKLKKRPKKDVIIFPIENELLNQ